METVATPMAVRAGLRVRARVAWLVMGAALAATLLLTGCVAGTRQDLDRKGYHSDEWYRQRHEQVVEGVYIRQRRVSWAEMETMRAHAEFREIWIEQQRRRIAARRQTFDARIARREAYLREQAGTLGLLEERRKAEAANRERLLNQYRQTQAETAAGLERRRREEQQARARDLQKFQEAGQPPNG